MNDLEEEFYEDGFDSGPRCACSCNRWTNGDYVTCNHCGGDFIEEHLLEDRRCPKSNCNLLIDREPSDYRECYSCGKKSLIEDWVNDNCPICKEPHEDEWS